MPILAVAASLSDLAPSVTLKQHDEFSKFTELDANGGVRGGERRKRIIIPRDIRFVGGPRKVDLVWETITPS